MSADEERLLAEAIARGDAVARDRMIVANLSLAKKIAQRWNGQGLDPDDLIAEATCGLIRAVDQFDPGRGARFGTYASYWIKQSLTRAVEDSGTLMPLPAHMWKQVRKWKSAAGVLAAAMGRAPTSDEIAESLGLSRARACHVATALTAGVTLASTLAAAGSGVSLLETCSDGIASWAEQDDPGPHEILRQRLKRLDGRERLVLSLRYGLNGNRPHSLPELGARLGISRQSVRLIQLGAERKLRAPGPIPDSSRRRRRAVKGQNS